MKKIRIIALAALAVFFGACAFADAPEVVRAFSINGRFHCWVTGFADNPGSYAVQYRPYGSGDVYQNLGTTTGNWYGNGLPFNAEHCIVSEYPVLNGKYEFRISTADDMENWTDFIVDARHPLPGFEYYSGTGASSQTTFDSQINTYTLFNEAEAVNWFAVDLGEPKMLTSVAAVMNGGPGAIIEGSMDHDFSSVVTLKTLSAAEVDPTVFYSAGLGEPAVVRYVRIKNLGSGWFSVWELELDEGFFVSNDGTADKYPVFTIDSSISAEYGAAFFRSTDENSGFVEIGRVAAGATSWTDTSIGEDTTCYYRVAPIDSNGDALAPADYTLSYFRTLAPKVTKALAFNGKMNVWIEDFDQWNADLYDFQYRLSPSDAWVDYSKFTTGSNNTTGHPFGPSRMTLENNWKGVVEWRVAFKTLPGHWFNFTVDFGNPLGGTSIADYGEASGNSNSAQQTADGLLDTYSAYVAQRTVTWIDASGELSDKAETVEYGKKATFPWAYFEKVGDGTYIYSMSVETSVDGGANWSAQGR
ncbi:MAG: hypothetical protein ILO34_05305, partial [Kiritimatiellae bacterium]|nr:hypothetical protein [Kiritimatiellia bacterium]